MMVLSMDSYCKVRGNFAGTSVMLVCRDVCVAL